MRYALLLAAVGGLLAWQSFAGGWWLPALWPAVAYLSAAAVYAEGGAALFPKRPDGTVSPGAVAVGLPFLLPLWLLWHAVRLASREPVWNEVAPGLRIGRRVLPHELPPDTALVVDLTAEFVEPAGVRAGRRYLAVPLLDGTCPHPTNHHFAGCVMAVAADPGPVFIHCAQGHGRTGLFTACVLLARGLAADADDAVRRVRAARPGVRLSAGQQRFVREWWDAQARRASEGGCRLSADTRPR